MLDWTNRPPANRGSADAYYWRLPRPHYYDSTGVRVTPETGMTEAEVAEYMKAYDNETDRKDWGAQ